MSDERPAKRALGGAIWRSALRLAVIGACVFAAHLVFDAALALTERLPEASRGPMQTGVMVLALTLYAALIAIPFVPGIEVGLALMVLRGASIAPAVYFATLLGLGLAFLVGRFMPDIVLVRLLRDLRLRRAADLCAQFSALAPAHRQEWLAARLPTWLAMPLVRHRYLSLAVLLNVPGNALLGGGGGLLLVAGLSRMFSPQGTLLTVALAVLPVPFWIWWFGLGFLS
ncbi:hypothetical protein V8J82_17370 [Gymnodinialimonas sp. 2305UL16-5]|uniref:hypothetical protein n=1 Tax=Gymnodinialimonas mytili TaxID=3126503 RepID=UPI00309B30AA